MVKLPVPRNALGNVDLRLEAMDAGVGRVRLSHDSADAASDPLRNEQLGVAHRHAAVLVAADDRSHIQGTRVLVKLEVPVNLWLKQNIVFAFFLIYLHWSVT